jgi:CubicO group peptidase (beta-lactamase class C family)
MAALAACGDTPERPAQVDAGNQADWIGVPATELGFDADRLEAARAYGFQDEFYTQAIIVIRHGYLAAEWYAEDSSPAALANSWSIAKSVTATLVGMAIADGDIEGVDVPLADFIPAWQGTDRAEITLHDALAMSTGLDFLEDYEQYLSDAGRSDVMQMMLAPDAMAVALDQPVRDPAGEVWSYSSGDTMLLGYALRQATGKTAALLAQERLAEPMDMQELHWWQDAAGETYTFCCLDATARDFAKFGQLYLQDGVWGGEQLVPEQWIRDATSQQASSNLGYGYQWWLNHPDSADGNWTTLPESTYFALGHDGQYVAIFPELDMVVVRMGQYILPETDDWIAPGGLIAAGIFSSNMGPTGTRAPEGDWSEDQFFRGFVDAVVR